MELQLKQYDIAERQLEAERKAQKEVYVRQLRETFRWWTSHEM